MISKEVSEILPYLAETANVLEMGAFDLEVPLPPKKQPQGRWLIDDLNKRCYWQGTDAPDALPAVLKGLKFGGQPPKPFLLVSQQKEGSHTRKASKSKGVLLYELDEYIARAKPSTGKQARDRYNAFGRFSTASASSFIPAGKDKAVAESIVSTLKSKDTTFQRVIENVSEAGRSPSGYPNQVVVESGQILDLVEETALGAVYAEGKSPAKQAARDPERMGALEDLRLNVGESAPIKITPVTPITLSVMRMFEGEKRTKRQLDVMGESAGAVAANAGYAPNEGAGWEWLHLIAHSMGGLEIDGPQVAANLVAGTSECNTQMIIVEEFIKDYISKWDGTASLCVMAEMSDTKRHIGGIIRYHFYISNKAGEPVEVYIWSFDALSRNNPMTMQNRALRTAGRMVLEGGGKGKTTAIIGSEPTDPEQIKRIEAAETAVLNAVRTSEALPELIVKKLLEMKDAVFGGEISDLLFSAIGEKAPMEQWEAYAVLIGEAFDSFDQDAMKAGAYGQIEAWVGDAANTDGVTSAAKKLVKALEVAPKVVTPQILLEIIGESTKPELLDYWESVVDEIFGSNGVKEMLRSFVGKCADDTLKGDGSCDPIALKQAVRLMQAEPENVSVPIQIGQLADQKNIEQVFKIMGDKYGPAAAEAVIRAFLDKNLDQALRMKNAEGAYAVLSKAADLLKEKPTISVLTEIGQLIHGEAIERFYAEVGEGYGPEAAKAVFRAFFRKSIDGIDNLEAALAALAQAADLLKEPPEMSVLVRVGQLAGPDTISKLIGRIEEWFGPDAGKVVLEGFRLIYPAF